MPTPAGFCPRRCHPRSESPPCANSAAMGAAACRDRCSGASFDGSRGRRPGRCHTPPPTVQGRRECSPVAPPHDFRSCERPGIALHPPQKARELPPWGRHRCRRCSVHRGCGLVGRRPRALWSGDGRSPSTSPVRDESDCCACRSSPGRLPQPRPCPVTVWRQHRRASHSRAVVPTASDRSVAAVDPQPGDSPVTSRSGRP